MSEHAFKYGPNGEPTILDLYSGVAGFTLAFESAGFSTLAFVEFNETKRTILQSYYPDIEVFCDIDEFDGRKFLESHGRPHVVTGGVPCGPTSLLGKRLGTTDERWKWGETVRVVSQVRPIYCVFENPPALLSLESGRAFNGIVSAMAALGYDGWWDVIPAAAFGAGHWRERLCIVFADANGQSGQALSGSNRGIRSEGRDGILNDDSSGQGILSADTDHPRSQRHSRNGGRSQGWSNQRRPDAAPGLPDLRGRVSGPDWWFHVIAGIPCVPAQVAAYSRIPVLAPGLPNKLVEAASLCVGDSIVPAAFQPIAEALFQAIQAEETSGGETDKSVLAKEP